MVIVSAVSSSRWFAVDMTSRDVIETHADAAERIDCLQFSPGKAFTFLAYVLFQRWLGGSVVRALDS